MKQYDIRVRYDSMEKNLLRNIYKLMILMRNDVYNLNNQRICECILQTLCCKENNKVLLCKLCKIININMYLNFLDYENSECVAIKKTELNILIAVIKKIQNCLKSKQYDFAYDLIDALHIFPEILSDNKKIILKDYWNIYFSDVEKKYNKEDVKMIKKYFKHIWLK